MDTPVKTPEINSWGLLTETNRMDGPCFVNTLGDEMYQIDEWIISIHAWGTVSVARKWTK